MEFFRSLKGANPALRNLGAAAAAITRGAGVYLDEAGVKPAAGDKKPEGIALATVAAGGEVLVEVVSENAEYYIEPASGVTASDIKPGKAYTLSTDGVTLAKTAGTAVVVNRALEDGYIVCFKHPTPASSNT